MNDPGTHQAAPRGPGRNVVAVTGAAFAPGRDMGELFARKEARGWRRGEALVSTAARTCGRPGVPHGNAGVLDDFVPVTVQPVTVGGWMVTGWTVG